MQRLGQLRKLPLDNRGIRREITGWTKNRRELVRPQASEQKIGVGDGQRTTGSVTGRTGSGSRRTGAHPQLHAVLLNDRATSGCNGFDG